MFLLIAAVANVSRAADYADLPVIKPIMSCSNLANSDLSKVADTPGVVTSAEVTDTAQGQFCKVTARVDPLILVTVSLPVERWTQRYIQYGGGGGTPGSNGYGQAGTCLPALTGQFVFGINNLGHILPTTPRTHATVESWDWARDPQSRIDFGYRATHVNALIARALIKAYYGREPRYSYLMGCSEGGREALNEVQRYPDDFDGVSAGAPAALQTAQETTAHLWIVQADRRADGTNILMPEKRKLAHDAVLAQCDTFSGLKDGLLQDPRACHFDPATLQCAPTSADTSRCLTAEEVMALQKIYAGASDHRGDHLMFGLERGGEAQWGLPDTPTAEPPGAREAALSRAYMILPEVTPAASDFSHLEFTKASFELGSTLSPLYDAANTDLRRFAAHGGKLILWHGLSDFEIPPEVTLAYYHGVQKFMGAQATERTVRLFLLPGVGHCRGGDGYDQLDVPVR